VLARSLVQAEVVRCVSKGIQLHHVDCVFKVVVSKCSFLLDLSDRGGDSF